MGGGEYALWRGGWEFSAFWGGGEEDVVRSNFKVNMGGEGWVE